MKQACQCALLYDYLVLLAMSLFKNGNHGGIKSTLFMVDDEPILLELAEAILRPLGFDVRTFIDPQVALEAFAAANPPPAIVITDYEMNAELLNGMDLIRECRRIHPQQKIILQSGTVDERIFANAPDKPDFFLPKPYQVERLVTMIHSLVPESHLLAKQ